MATKKIEGQLTLNQMLKALDKDTAGGIEKKLKKLSKKSALKAPLHKNKADLIERKAAYEATTKKITKWEPIVEKNRKAKQLKFPLDQEPDVLPTAAECLSTIKPCNEFEEEILGALSSSKTALHDNHELTKAEEKYLKAISIEEAQARHIELQKMRVLLGSYAAKMRRQKAIKSKSYRRLLKHEKLRSHMKKVESNQDLLMDEIEKLRKLRAQERASLKHKNTGKWAKHAKFRAKYDEDARNAMIEQIGIAGKLLKKPVEVDSEESEADFGDDNDSDSDESSLHEDENDSTKQPPSKVPKPLSNQIGANDRLIVSSELINTRSKKRKPTPQKGSDAEGSDSSGDDEDDDGEDDEQRKLMSEAFADDDVVAEFQKAKEALVDEEQPKDVNLFLPGWGGWTGPGIKVDRKKRRKYIIKAKKKPRKDDNLGNVIISEQADDKIKEVMVKKLPRGVKNDEQFVKLLSKPTTATFTNQISHRDIIKPRVETKMGARIEPISQKVVEGGEKAKWS